MQLVPRSTSRADAAAKMTTMGGGWRRRWQGEEDSGSDIDTTIN